MTFDSLVFFQILRSDVLRFVVCQCQTLGWKEVSFPPGFPQHRRVCDIHPKLSFLKGGAGLCLGKIRIQVKALCLLPSSSLVFLLWGGCVRGCGTMLSSTGVPRVVVLFLLSISLEDKQLQITFILNT